MSKSFLSFLLFVALAFLTACDRARERTNVLTGRGEPELTVMDFSAPFSLDPPPAGWYHRTFWTRGPMQMAFAVKDGVPALRFETRSTASMLFRHVDLDLADYQFLIWRWYIEEPIANGGDEDIRQWRSEQVDLREVYRHIWPDGAPAHLIDIAIFCDSDETHGHTVSYFADVKLRR